MYNNLNKNNKIQNPKSNIILTERNAYQITDNKNDFYPSIVLYVVSWGKLTQK